MKPRFGLGDKVRVSTRASYWGDWKGQEFYIVGVRFKWHSETPKFEYETNPHYPPKGPSEKGSEGSTTDWPEDDLELVTVCN